MPTPRPTHNADVLAHLGQQLRQIREAAGRSQGGLRHHRQGQPRPLRQATVSHIENGHDVTLDSFISYVSALGLELLSSPSARPPSSSRTCATEADCRPRTRRMNRTKTSARWT